MKTTLWISLATACLLTACGGGGGGETAVPAPPAPETAQVPASASGSTAGLVDYLMTLKANESEDSEPVSLAGFDPVTPDTEEATAIN